MLDDFCVINKLITSSEYGFMRNRGTNDTLAFTAQYIYKNIDKNIPTALVFMVLAKAFGTINHKILLEKLWRLGVRGVPQQLIPNYLMDREQSVKIN